MTDTNPPAYLDRDGKAWPVRPDGCLVQPGTYDGWPQSDVVRAYGPLVPLWPEGKAPLPENAYVWTKGDDKAELTNRIVEGAHVTVERDGEAQWGFVIVDDDGWKQLGGEEGSYLVDNEGDLCTLVRSANRITVTPPPEPELPEPELPEWVTYRGEGYGMMFAVTSDGWAWWPYVTAEWVRRDGVERITDAELIAQGGRLLIDHTGHAATEGR